MGKRLPHAKRPRALKPRRSSVVIKQGGTPYTPKHQYVAVPGRNERRVRGKGRSEAHENSLVAMLTLSPVGLANRLRALGFLKHWTTCPKCGSPLVDVVDHRGRVYCQCQRCPGNGARVSCLRGSCLDKCRRLSLAQVAALLVCFSEGVLPVQAASLCGVSRPRVSEWFSLLRRCLGRKMSCMQKEFGKQGGSGLVSEADEASISSGPIPTPTSQTLRFHTPASSHSWLVGRANSLLNHCR